MMGVITNSADENVVREFFELFKIPWEFVRDNRQYETVLCAGDAKPSGVAAKLLLLYSSGQTAFDMEQGIQVRSQASGAALSYKEKRLPIYGNIATFQGRGANILLHEGSREPVAFVEELEGKAVARVGYDLFREVEILLRTGQPVSNANIPTLELHIEFLRDKIISSGIPLMEIPPVPDGYRFAVCLTHDVDHASLARHRFDKTAFGFLYRATVGSVLNVLRGRLSLRNLMVNWAAAAKLPFLYLGLAKDIWLEFDRYVEIENGKPSTFFIIPYEGRPGCSIDGPAPQSRASRYDVSHITEKLRRLVSAGCEIGLHGIDAWANRSAASEEAQRMTGFTETGAVGVRMHWLYWNQDSPAKLEDAGFLYDSTVGYNETVGYRAGTCQAYKPVQAARLLELPLHVMDTALFYPDYLDLSFADARKRLAPLVENAERFGGLLTINWHDRSIAPERQWGDFYVQFLDELAAKGAWFCTASQAVAWFQKRRSATFKVVDLWSERPHALVSAKSGRGLPGLRLRYHQGGIPSEATGTKPHARTYFDRGFDGSSDVYLQN